MENNEDTDGIRFVWNNLPSSRTDATLLTVPVGFHYQPCKLIETMPLLEYEPVMCKSCKAVLNPFNLIDFNKKIWNCPFCNTSNLFSNLYAQNISPDLLPTELRQEFTTVEYKLNKKESNYPTFLLIIDTGVDEEELLAIKENIQQVLSELPQECSIGVISFGTICQVHELGFSEFPVSYNFKGDIEYKPIEIQEMLGLITLNKNTSNNNAKFNNYNIINNNNLSKYIVPLKDCELAINTLLDELLVDPFGKKNTERYNNCAGLALQIGISMLELTNHYDPTRIQLFLGGPPTMGYGKIVNRELSQVVRNWIDFENNTNNIQHYKSALEYYDSLALRAAKSGQIIDLFCCCFNQVGAYEMRGLIEKTGGIMVMSDSFTTVQFKKTYIKLFELDDNGNLKMNFKAKIEVNSSKPVYISGAIGFMISLETKGNNVSSISCYSGNTKSWWIGGLDFNSSYAFLLDINEDSSSISNNKNGVVQILTTYIAGDRSHRLRVTTVCKSIVQNICNNNTNMQQIIKGFDQEAACVLLSKISVLKGIEEDFTSVLKWLDKTLIRLLSKACSYRPNDKNSFKIPRELDMFPQFMFYLRRSPFVQHFNASIDEVCLYRSNLLHENVENCAIMIQPVLFSYTAEEPEATPVFLDIQNMKCDNVLFLDTFFNIVIWHSEDVCNWRNNQLHLNEEYSNIKMMLDNPQDYAQQLMNERIPVPKLISCDAGSGQERHIKSVVDPSSNGSSSKVISDGFASDDVTLSKFMEYLIKVVVSSNN